MKIIQFTYVHAQCVESTTPIIWSMQFCVQSAKSLKESETNFKFLSHVFYVLTKSESVFQYSTHIHHTTTAHREGKNTPYAMLVDFILCL